MERENRRDLSLDNRYFIVTLTLVSLLVFYPIEGYSTIGRTACLIAIPSVMAILLKACGGRLNIDSAANDRIRRALLGAIAGALLVEAGLSYTSRHHTECDQYARTRDGAECVGDYVTVPGADKGGALMWGLLAGLALWFSIKRTD